MLRHLTIIVSSSLVTFNVARAAEPVTKCGPEARREAIARGLNLAQKAAASYPSHRQCFSCHHQTLPMLAMVSARACGSDIDNELLQAQADFSINSFRSTLPSIKEGRSVGGRALTVAYALWALHIAGHRPDEMSEALVTFLFKTQESDGRWKPQTHRPPMEESAVTCTVLSALAIGWYATPDQRQQADEVVNKAKAWLAEAPRESQEDRVSWLWGLHKLGFDQDKVNAARKAVLAAQRDDGGWAQLDSMDSDAYATGQTLWVLRQTGLEPSDAAYERGVAFLLKAQRDDGSWFVETRSRPVQVFFDNGDPHGKNQFISMPATCWAVAALAAAAEPPKAP